MTPCRWDFISANAGAFGVQRLCRVLGVSRSGYYRWRMFPRIQPAHGPLARTATR